MKIIDFGTKGNVVRFYLGEDDCTDYWGDDWDDPFDNAGTVYEQYVKEYIDVSFPFDWVVTTPADDYSRYSYRTKEALKDRQFPCVIAVPREVWEKCDSYYYGHDYDEWLGADGVYKFYYEDPKSKVWLMDRESPFISVTDSVELEAGRRRSCGEAS